MGIKISLEQVVGFRSGLSGHSVRFGLFLMAQGEDCGAGRRGAAEADISTKSYRSHVGV